MNLFNFKNNFSFSKKKSKTTDKNNKMVHILLFKEQFKYLKTTHSYHLVDPSPWPALASLGAFMITSGLVLYMHKFIGGWNLFQLGFIVTFYVMYTWWRGVIREATFEDQHSVVVQKSLRLGIILFIVSEIMFFFAFFWAFFHSSIATVLHSKCCFNISFLDTEYIITFIRIIIVSCGVMNDYRKTGLSNLPWLTQFSLNFPYEFLTSRKLLNIIGRFRQEYTSEEEPLNQATFADWGPLSFSDLERARQTLLCQYATSVAEDTNSTQEAVLNKILTTRNSSYYDDYPEVVGNCIEDHFRDKHNYEIEGVCDYHDLQYTVRIIAELNGFATPDN